MDKFTASNGYRIEPNLGGLAVFNKHPNETVANVHSLGQYSTEALREFFRAEEDERLGRWRWPENPDYVVYASGPDTAEVLEESSGTARRFWRETVHEAPSTGVHERLNPAARAFFDAHPEPKPWTEAKVGEIWALTIRGKEAPVTFRPGIGLYMNGARAEVDEATAGRRIWPEETES